MKIFVSLLLAMSASGTLALLAYWLICHAAEKQISASLRYFLLKLCLMFFLIPFPMIKQLLYNIYFRPASELLTENGEFFLDVKNTLILSDQGFSLRSFTLNHWIIFAIWGLIICGTMFFLIYRYVHFRRSIGRRLFSKDTPTALSDALHASAAVPDNIPVYYCDAPVSPFTCGVFHPAVVLTSLVTAENAVFVLQHEIHHIKAHDIFFRLLAALVFILHCFNPIVFIFLFRELTEVQEMNCDEKLTRNFTRNEKTAYGNFLIDIANASRPAKAPAVFFSKHRPSFLKKRIERIAGISVKKSFAACLLSAILCCAAAALPVAAYSAPVLDVRSNPLLQSMVMVSPNTTWTSFNNSEDFLEKTLAEEKETLLQYYDEILVLEDGTAIPLPAENTSAYQANCSHTFLTGYRKEHKMNGTGCTVYTYQAEYCSKCYYIKNKTLNNRSIYEVCPHR